MNKIKYYVLLKIPVPNSRFFIEIGLDRELPFHPNLTDEIEVESYISKITSIYYDMDELTHVFMRAEAVDGLLWNDDKNKLSDEDIHKYLQSIWKSLKEWCHGNGERIVLNDWYKNPESDWDDIKIS